MNSWRQHGWHGVTTLVLGGIAAGSAVASDRWYSAAQVQRGAAIYGEHCASCHGAAAEGQANWEQRDDMGFYPAPPLTAAGHAWHHPLEQMMEQLAIGGGPIGGTMPSFTDVLVAADRIAVVAYVQSLWPEDIYQQWVAIDAGEAAPPVAAQHEH